MRVLSSFGRDGFNFGSNKTRDFCCYLFKRRNKSGGKVFGFEFKLFTSPKIVLNEQK